MKSLFEINNKKTTIYDGLHRYCRIENMNEEYLRVSIKKERRSILIRILQGILCIGVERQS